MTTSNILIDNGSAIEITHAGLTWTKTVFPSYRNYRTERFFVGQTAGNYWKIWDGGRPRREVFTKPEEAMTFAAALIEVAA